MAWQPPYPARWTWPACDPELPSRLRTLVTDGTSRRSPANSGGPVRRWLGAAAPRARRAVISSWTASGAALVGAFVTAAPALGVGTDVQAGFWVVFGVAGVTGLVLGRELSPERELAKQSRHVIMPNQVDEPSRLLLARAQQAIDYVCSSGVGTAGLIDHAADEVTLQRHEWDIACALRDISALRERFNANAMASGNGEITRAVLESQRRAIAVAQDATQARVAALERYAAQVRAADTAHQDWQTAQRLAGQNDMYLQLVARTAADAHAVAELDGMITHATAAAEVLRDSLHRASLAAEVLTLPAPIVPQFSHDDAEGQQPGQGDARLGRAQGQRGPTQSGRPTAG
jgi:hypothetical protein